MNDIKMKVGRGKPLAVSKYLRTLIDLAETLGHEKPGKKTIYMLADNFFRFWYRLCRSMRVRSLRRITKTYPHAVKQYLSDYSWGLDLYMMCQDYLLVLCGQPSDRTERDRSVVSARREKKKQIQIDIVGTPVAGKSKHHWLL